MRVCVKGSGLRGPVQDVKELVVVPCSSHLIVSIGLIHNI